MHWIGKNVRQIELRSYAKGHSARRRGAGIRDGTEAPKNPRLLARLRVAENRGGEAASVGPTILYNKLGGAEKPNNFEPGGAAQGNLLALRYAMLMVYFPKHVAAARIVSWFRAFRVCAMGDVTPGCK